VPSWLYTGTAPLAAVAAKAALMYLTALLGLRVAHRRTLARWTAIDVAAAVAGAIVGRTAVASSEPLLVGVVALLAVLLAHALLTFGRYLPWLTKLTDHRIRVLVDHGRLRRRQLLVCGLTEADLFAQLREQGVGDLEELRYVLYETTGELTVVREHGDGSRTSTLVARGLEDAAGT
jgi:uncharacterized membrane protein YcaP (DUF421 family)